MLDEFREIVGSEGVLRSLAALKTVFSELGVRDSGTL